MLREVLKTLGWVGLALAFLSALLVLSGLTAGLMLSALGWLVRLVS